MLRIFFLFVVCSCTLLAVGQEISGNVYDQEGTPLPFSNVILLNTRDSSLFLSVNRKRKELFITGLIDRI